VNIPLEQEQQIIKNFYLLCNAFLPSQEVKDNIKITFQEQELEGKTFFKFNEKKFVISF